MDPQVKLLREAITMLDEFQISLPPGVAEETRKGRALAMIEVINAGDALRRAVAILEGEESTR